MKQKKATVAAKKNLPLLQKNEAVLFQQVCRLVEESRQRVAVTVNREMTMMYWQVGKLIKNEILHTKRADYGSRIVALLSEQLTSQYGKGWSKQQIWHCLYTVETFPNEKIISTYK